MNIKLTPDQEKIIRDELESGRFRTPEEVVSKALHSLRQSSSKHGENGSQQEAVREMLAFVEKNCVRLEGISVRDLIHEGHDL